MFNHSFLCHHNEVKCNAKLHIIVGLAYVEILTSFLRIVKYINSQLLVIRPILSRTKD